MAQEPYWDRASSLSRIHDHTLTHTPFGRNPLDEWSARRRDLYLTTHDTHTRQTSMPPAWFQPAVPASERPQTHAVDRAAIRTGSINLRSDNYRKFCGRFTRMPVENFVYYPCRWGTNKKFQNFQGIRTFVVKVKQTPCRPGQFLRDHGGWGSQISSQSAHESGQVVSFRHRLLLPSRKYSWYSFLLEAESTPGP